MDLGRSVGGRSNLCSALLSPGSLAFGSLGVLVCGAGGLGGIREVKHVQSLAQNLAGIKCAITTAVVNCVPDARALNPVLQPGSPRAAVPVPHSV